MVKPENILPKSVSALSLKDDTEKPNKKKTHSPTTISPTSAGNLISPPRISTPSDSSKSSGNTETLFRQVSGNTAIPLRQTSLFKQLPVSPVSAKSPTTSEQDVEDTGKRSPNPIVYGARKSSLFDRNSVDYYQLLAQGRKKSVDASHEDNDNNRDSISPSYEQFVSGLAEKLGIDLNGMPVQDSVAKKQNNPYASDVTVLDFAPNEGQTPREKLNSHIGSKHSKASTDLTDLCDLVAGHRTSMAPSHVSVAESDVTELEISTLGRPSRRRPSLETRVGYIGSDRRTSMHFPRRPSIDEETEPVSASTARKMDILPSIPSRSDSKVWKRVTLPPSPPLAVKTINIIGAHKRNGSSPLPSSEQLVVKTAQLTRARTIGRNDDSTARVSPTKDIPPDSMEFKISIDGARIVRFRGSKQISYAEFIDLLSSKLGKLAILNSQWMLKDGQVVIKSILHSTMSIDTSRGWDELVTRVGPETMHLNVLLEMQ